MISGGVSRSGLRLGDRGCLFRKFAGLESAAGIRVKAQSVHYLEAVFFDDRVGEHFLRYVLELFLRFVAAPAVEIQNEEFSLADVAHGGVAEAGERVLDRLALGIEYGTFWHYPDVCFHAAS